MFQFDDIKWCLGSKEEAWCDAETTTQPTTTTTTEPQNQTEKVFKSRIIASLDGPLKNCSLAQGGPRLGYKTAWRRACIKGSKQR